MSTYPGSYRIKNVETGTYLTMTSTGSKTSVTCAQSESGDKKSLWQLVPARDGKFKLKNVEHNLEAQTGQDFAMVGELKGHSWFIRDGTSGQKIIHTGKSNFVLEFVKVILAPPFFVAVLQLKADKSQKSQRWTFESAYAVPLAVYVIKNVKTGTVMDLAGAREGAGVQIFGYSFNGGGNQKWDIKPGTGPLDITIRSVLTNAYAAYPTAQQDENLQTSLEPQEFVITAADKGYYISPVKRSDQVIDLAGADAADGTRICLWVKENSDHQKWYFEQV
ncbi:Ricin-type beta-trefoil, partial [Rhizoctonia solani]